MSSKAISTIHSKLKEAVEIDFPTSKEFEEQFSVLSPIILKTLTSLVEEYRKLRSNGDPFIVRTSCDEYIAKRIHREYGGFSRGYSASSDENERLADFKRKRPEEYERFGNDYQKRLEIGDGEIVLPLRDYFLEKFYEFTSGSPNESERSTEIREAFWGRFRSKHLGEDGYSRLTLEQTLSKSGLILQGFKEEYLSNRFIKLLDLAEKTLAKADILGFDIVIVNVGVRDFESSRNGWRTSNFVVTNKGRKFKYSVTSKDDKPLKGEFINIYVLKPTKKHLEKYSIHLEETEFTAFTIWKELEKVSIKNEVELHISKHHGNETIIFDSEREVRDFHSRIIEVKEGSRRKD